MENLIFSLNATIPIFLMMLLGMLFRKLGWMDEVFAAKMNKFVFLVPLPVLLFEQLAKDYGNVPSQMLLVPVQVNLTAAEKQAVLQNLDLLTDAGIEAEDFGGSTVVVRAVPADVAVDDVEDMLVELAAKLADGGRDALREKTEWVLHSIACRAAIKAGDRTNAAEMLALAQHIMDGTVPPFCPHGRPCVLKITRKELEKQFGRLV